MDASVEKGMRLWEFTYPVERCKIAELATAIGRSEPRFTWTRKRRWRRATPM